MIDSVLDFSNLMKAWQRVKDNHGCPGVDGVSIEAFEKTPKRNMSALVSEITDRCYSPLPLLRLLVEKPSGGPRPLSIPAVRDRLIQTAVLNVVEPLFEQEFEQCSFAYRKGRSVKQAALQIREYRDQGYQYVVEVDIEAFFDNVDHQLLMGKVTKVLSDTDVIHLIERWITNHVWDGEKVYRLTKGIPQGSPISPILANLFLDELDETLLNSGYRLVRYSDDFVVLCKSKKEAETALELTDDVLE
ncbi:MAG: reverse transcriptase domain-containing protein, partial [Thermodesulfobacteriota bacterium]|nr:reverse transcriptase domain-containing protein [Thermodesulfobacteriota bacterium]